MNKTAAILNIHYQRWLFGPGQVQLNAWRCDRGRYNFSQSIPKKINREFGSIRQFSFCNAITDQDIYVIAGVVEILGAESNYREKVFSGELKKQVSNFLVDGLSLVNQRFDIVNIKSSSGKKGLIFDEGAWNDHADFKYSEISDVAEKRSSTKPKKTSWDLSHGRRILNLLQAMYQNEKVVEPQIKVRQLLEHFSNQFYYVVYDKDNVIPRFSNFLNGNNGWYRVGYRNRKNFGFGPYEMSNTAITGGYLWLKKFNPNINDILKRIYSSQEACQTYSIELMKPLNIRSKKEIKQTLQFLIAL